MALVVGSSVAARQPAAPPSPARSLKDLIARAGRYVVDYGERMSLVVGVERYTQWLRRAGADGAETRSLVSEFVLVRVADDWVGFRDVVEVDGSAIEDRRDRLVTLLIEEPAEGLRQGRRIADESARYNLGAVQRNFNTPTMALFFLRPKNQERFRFAKAREETIDGVRVWEVSYRETGRPTIVRTTAGRSVPASGTLWIDPANGQVLRTRMDLRAELEGPAGPEDPGRGRTRVETAVSVRVSYRPDERFGVLLPSEMRETYEVVPARGTASPEPPATITCLAIYSDYRTFETFGRVIIR